MVYLCYMETVQDNLALYITKFIEEKGWSARELGRRIGVSHSTVSEVANGTRRPTADFCIALSRVTPESDVAMLRLAGVIAPLPPATAEEEEILDILRKLAQSRILEYNCILRVIRAFKPEFERVPEPHNVPAHLPDLGKLIEAMGEIHEESPSIYHNVISMICGLTGGISPPPLISNEELANLDLLTVIEEEYPDAPLEIKERVSEILITKARQVVRCLIAKGELTEGDESHERREGETSTP